LPRFVKNTPGVNPIIEKGKLNLDLLRGESRNTYNNNDQKLVLQEPPEPNKPGLLGRLFSTRKVKPNTEPNIEINSFYQNEKPEPESKPGKKANKLTRKNTNFTNFMSRTRITR